MTASQHARLPRILRGALGFALCCAVWEVFARSGMFSAALTPPLETVLSTAWTMLVSGHLLHSVASTLGRVLVGFAISLALAVPCGVMMGRSHAWERLVAPPLSAFLPVPSLAWVPLLILWFGIGNVATIIVVVYAATTQLIYNVWMGVRAVNPLWARAAGVMGAGRLSVLVRVVLPGAMPYIFTGMRLGFGRAWIAVIGGELLSSPRWGLGTVIFNAGEFLNTATMLSALLVIGLIGVFFEQVVFNSLERVTVRRWGMVAGKRDEMRKSSR